jgi:DNA-binding YbaB/EbfC family protein
MAVPNFGQMKEMYQLQKKAKQLQKELKDMEIEARSTDGEATVVVSGEMKVVSIDINPEYLKTESKTIVENALRDAVNQAMGRAQTESANRMQPLLKDLKLPGM